MVRLEITIKEINSLDYKEIAVAGTEISIHEIGRKATKNEKEVSNILKKRLKVDEKLQFKSENEKIKKAIEEILKSL
jgi:hypothetical protein